MTLLVLASPILVLGGLMVAMERVESRLMRDTVSIQASRPTTGPRRRSARRSRPVPAAPVAVAATVAVVAGSAVIRLAS